MVPGVSGGTIALVTGIYARAVKNANALLHVVRTAISDRSALRTAMREVEWKFLIAIGVGMFTIVLTMSRVMHTFVEERPQTAKALFLGMVAVSLLVPIRLIGKENFLAKKVPATALFVVAAVAVFFLTGFTSAEKHNPSLVVIFFAAAIAICALVLPGISGSFILLSIGLYQPVIGAVADRNLPVLGVFALGAITGLALFIKLLNHLVFHHHTLTMATMAGIMLGSLRALWPWQDANANLQAPSNEIGWLLSMILLGGVIASGIMILERFVEKETE